MSEPTPDEIQKAKAAAYEINARREPAPYVVGVIAHALHSHAAEAVKARDEEWNREVFAGWITPRVDGPAEAMKRRRAMWEEWAGNAVKAAVEAQRKEMDVQIDLARGRGRALDELAEECYEARSKIQAALMERDAARMIGRNEAFEENQALRKRVEELEAAERLRLAGDRAASMFDFLEIASARTSEVDYLVGISNDVHNVLKVVTGDFAWRIQGHELPGAIQQVFHGYEMLAEQARREGAEEMRERAASKIEKSYPHNGEELRHRDWDCRGCEAEEHAAEIRALPIDPPKAERPMTVCNVQIASPYDECGNQIPCPMHPPDAPKAQEERALPLGHPFNPRGDGTDVCRHQAHYGAICCGKPEADHKPR